MQTEEEGVVKEMGFNFLRKIEVDRSNTGEFKIEGVVWRTN